MDLKFIFFKDVFSPVKGKCPNLQSDPILLLDIAKNPRRAKQLLDLRNYLRRKGALLLV